MAVSIFNRANLLLVVFMAVYHLVSNFYLQTQSELHALHSLHTRYIRSIRYVV